MKPTRMDMQWARAIGEGKRYRLCYVEDGMLVQTPPMHHENAYDFHSTCSRKMHNTCWVEEAEGF